MLVCPNCRNENLEDANFCRVCGRSLEPSASPMRRIERPQGPELDDELPAARGPSPWPTVVLVVAMVLGLAVWGLFRATAVAPCASKYDSVLFTYCAEIPRGWSGGPMYTPERNIEEFERPDVGALTQIRVQQVLDPAMGTVQFAQQIRNSLEADGVNVTAIEVLELDGEQAIAWNYTLTQEGPPILGAPPTTTVVAYRDVVAVRPEGAYRIRFIVPDPSYPNYAQVRLQFEQMLQSWRWRS